jgi:diamine N-acetyltransferase
VADIVSLIKELAEYERLSSEVVATEPLVREALFGSQPRVWSLIAHWDGQLAGFAVYFFSFSTFLARPSLYLEDLFVRPAYRGRGIGKALLVRLAGIALDQECGRMEWAVLDWNASAIAFYRSLGAEVVDAWRICRLTGPALRDLAEPT